jgi:hypothetical protein
MKKNKNNNVSIDLILKYDKNLNEIIEDLRFRNGAYIFIITILVIVCWCIIITFTVVT